MLQIDPEFEGEIPPLTDEEYQQLEKNILAEGKLTAPIIVWNNLIVDGHNRYRIVQDHPEITYSVYQKDFPDRYAAIAWICENQLGRRNLTPQQKRYLIGQRYEAEKMAHGGARKKLDAKSTGLTDPLPGGGAKDKSHVTRQKIADETHTSDSYVKRAGEYAKGVNAAEEVSPGIKQKILNGEIKPTAEAVAAIAKAPLEERKDKVEQLSFGKKKLLPEIEYPKLPEEQTKTDAVEYKLKAKTTLGQIRELGERMATAAPITTLEDIFMELEDAAETMLDRWELAKKLNPELYRTEECQIGVQKLIEEVTIYFKNYGDSMKQ